MFERFDEDACEVMMAARRKAEAVRSEFVGTEHILFGIVAGKPNEGHLVLKLGFGFCVDPAEVARAVEREIASFPVSSSPTVSVNGLPFSPRAKRALELAERESEMRGSRTVGARDLLVGLVHEEEGIAHKVLAGFGVNADVLKVSLVGLGKDADNLRRRSACVKVVTRAEWTCRGCKTAAFSPSADDLPGSWTLVAVLRGRLGKADERLAAAETMALCGECSKRVDFSKGTPLSASVAGEVLHALQVAREILVERYGSDPGAAIAVVDSAIEALLGSKP